MTRGKGKGNDGERRGKGKQRNTNRGLMGKDNGKDCLWEWVGDGVVESRRHLIQ